jgi:Uncharacterised protein family (UPF0175)
MLGSIRKDCGSLENNLRFSPFPFERPWGFGVERGLPDANPSIILLLSMTLTLHIPDELSAPLEAACGNLPRAVLEGFSVEAYRQGRISTAEVGNLLAHTSRWETEEFLAAHNAWPGPTAEEVAADLQTLRALRQ